VTPESNTDYCAIIGIATEIRMLCEWCIIMHTQDVMLLCWYRYWFCTVARGGKPL